MNRRAALKGLTLGMGYVVAVPTVMSMLESCATETETWPAVFLTDKEKHMVVELVDIILPASDIPGGLDVNLPQFIDMMCKDVLNASDQEMFHQGSQVFAERFTKKFDKDIVKGKKKDILDLFSSYFDKNAEESSEILKTQRKNIKDIPADELQDFLMYKCLMTVRTFSLLGFFTSEKIGTEVLNFDPIPGVWEPCIPVSEVGNAWTI